MTREEFVAGYMKRSGVKNWSLNGEEVMIGEKDMRLALPCQCGKDGCEGWAMIPPHSRAWHLFMHGPDEGRPTYEEAIA